METINERIKKTRLLRNMTLLQLAEQIGVKEATVQRYESGEIKNIKHQTIINIANALDVTPTYLMGWETQTGTQPLNVPEKMFIQALRDLKPEQQKQITDMIQFFTWENSHEEKN